MVKNSLLIGSVWNQIEYDQIKKNIHEIGIHSFLHTNDILNMVVQKVMMLQANCSRIFQEKQYSTSLMNLKQ